jgi:hypothetical protein
MAKKYPIRLSTWYVREIPKKRVDIDHVDDLFSDDISLKQLRRGDRNKEREYIVRDIVVSGTSKEIPRMIGSSNYLFRVFSSIFGKEKAWGKIEAGKHEIVKIELNKETKGTGFGCLTD